MGVLDWVEKTREKPERTRYKIAVILTAIIMFAVVLVWLSITFVSNGDTRSSARSPISVIKEIF